jgi:hypothetical protein
MNEVRVGTRSRQFERFAAACAAAVGLGTLAYAIAFVLVLRTTSPTLDVLSAVLLLAGGILTTPVMVALFQRLRETDESFALWALLLGLVGALGSAVHGGFDVARDLAGPAARGGAASPIDPRGILTFAVSGLAILTFGWLIRRGGGLPKGLGVLGMVTGVVLVLIYLGRLIIITPTNPALLVAAAVAGFILNPGWFLWLARALARP